MDPGGSCRYDLDVPGANEDDLDLIETITKIRLFARDRTRRRDHQDVSAKFLFQHSGEDLGSSGWVTAKATKRFRKRADDDVPASFRRQSWLVPMETDGRFRIVVVLRWYRPGTTSKVQGWRRQRIDHYDVIWQVPLGIDTDSCRGRALPGDAM